MIDNKKQVFSFDVECFSNYFLVVFYSLETKEYKIFSYLDNGQAPNTASLISFLQTKNLVLCGFNNRAYDNLVLCAFLKTNSISATKEASDKIIKGKRGLPFTRPLSNTLQKIQLNTDAQDIDLMSLLNIKTSLKVCECIMGLGCIKESPIPFDATIQTSQVPEIIEYCKHDCFATAIMAMTKQAGDAIDVRKTIQKQFAIYDDIFSYSEPTLVSTIIPRLAKRAKGLPERTSFRGNKSFDGDCFGREIMDVFLSFDNQNAQSFLDITNAHSYIQSGKVIPLRKKVTLFGYDFNFALGGLHSVNTPKKFVASEESTILDLDVSSYYPALILKYSVAPETWKDGFLEVYRDIRDKRLAYKAQGKKDIADAYKLLLNSTFGKLKSENSVIHNKIGQLRVTLNGQMWLLKLIESILFNTTAVLIQANTDGITLEIKKTEVEKVRNLYHAWEQETGFSLEEKEYSKFYMVNVNNYLAVDTKGTRKTKGVFNVSSDFKSGRKIPNVVKLAIIEHLLTEKPIMEIIHGCKTPLDFLVFGKRFSLFYNGVLLSNKVYRGFYSVDGLTLESKSTAGNKTTVEHDFCILEDLKDFDFSKVDYARYEQEVQKYLIEGEIPDDEDEEIEYVEASEKDLKLREKTFSLFPGCDFITSKFGTDSSYIFSLESEQAYNLKLLIPHGVCVIDVDNPKKASELFQGKDLATSLVCAYATQDIQDIIACKTRGHLYFRLSDSDCFTGKRVIKDEKGKVVVELMGEGIAIRVPSSLHPEKEIPYNWLGSATSIKDLPEIPKDILELFPKAIERLEFQHNYKSWGVSLTELAQLTGRRLEYGQNTICPCHDDTTPSMKVNQNDTFFCFACQKTLGFDGFLAAVKGFSIPEARKLLDETELKLEVPALKITVDDREDLFIKIKTSITSLRDNDWMLFTAGTGLGKTHAVARYCVESLEPIIVFFSTTKEMTRFEGILKDIKPDIKENKDYSIFSSKAGKDTDDEAIITDTAKRIILAQTEYLFQKGHSLEGYRRIQKHLANRICFVDESHIFYKHLLESIPLIACYFSQSEFGKTLFKTDKCPRAMRKLSKDSACRCVFSPARLDAKNNNLPFYEFPYHIQRNSINADRDNPYSDWLDFSSYTSVGNTSLFYKFIENYSGFSQISDVPREFVDYVACVLNNLDNPHLRVELPNEENQTYPRASCKCPRLCGLNKFALLQLNTAKKAIFITATSNLEMEESFKKFKRGAFTKIEIGNKASERFPVILFKTKEHLSIDRIVKILQTLTQRAFVVTAYQSEAENLYDIAIKYVGGKTIKIFKERSYEQVQASNVDDAVSHYLLTYARASICTGIDIKDKSLVIVDCGQYIPLAAVGTIDKGATKEQIDHRIFEEIKTQISQIVGRVLRGEHRQIVVLLHNLPEALMNFDLSTEVAITSHHIENFFSRSKGKFVESVVVNLENAVTGNPLVDYSLEEIGTTIKITANKLSKRQRLNPDRAKEIAIQKQSGLEIRVKECKSQGMTWKQTCDKLNIFRKGKREQSQLKKVYENYSD